MANQFQFKGGITLRQAIKFTDEQAQEYYTTNYGQYGPIIANDEESVQMQVYDFLRQLSRDQIQPVQSPQRVQASPTDEDDDDDLDESNSTQSSRASSSSRQSSKKVQNKKATKVPVEKKGKKKTPRSQSSPMEQDDVDDDDLDESNSPQSSRASSSSRRSSRNLQKKQATKGPDVKKGKKRTSTTRTPSSTDQEDDDDDVDMNSPSQSQGKNKASSSSSRGSSSNKVQKKKTTKGPVEKKSKKGKPTSQSSPMEQDDDSDNDDNVNESTSKQKKKHYKKTVSDIQIAKYHGETAFGLATLLQDFTFLDGTAPPLPLELPVPDGTEEQNKMALSQNAYLCIQEAHYCEHEDCPAPDVGPRKTYPYKYHLLLHYMIEHVNWNTNLSEYKCPIGNCGFKGPPSDVMDHLCTSLAGHIDLRRFSCHLCSAAYRGMKVLKEHLNFHKAEEHHSDSYARDAEGKVTTKLLHKKGDRIYKDEDLVITFNNILNPLISDDFSVSSFINEYVDNVWVRFVRISARASKVNAHNKACIINQCPNARLSGNLFCKFCVNIPEALRQECYDINFTPTLLIDDQSSRGVYYRRQVLNQHQQEVYICGNNLCCMPYGNVSEFKSFCSKICLNYFTTNPPPVVEMPFSRQLISDLYPWQDNYNTPPTQLQTTFNKSPVVREGDPIPTRHAQLRFRDDGLLKIQCSVSACSTNAHGNYSCKSCNSNAIPSTTINIKPPRVHNFNVNVRDLDGVPNYTVNDTIWIKFFFQEQTWQRCCAHWGCEVVCSNQTPLFCRGHSFLYNDHLPAFESAKTRAKTI